MSAINYINSMSTSLVGVVAVGGTFACGYQALKWISAEDEVDVARAKKNIRRILIGVALGLSASGLVNFILGKL